jgi:hypothetical protein
MERFLCLGVKEIHRCAMRRAGSRMQRRRKRTDQPLRPRNRRVTRRSDLGRTLFTAGVFALLSMIFAPKAHYGYRLIFSAEATSHCVLSIDGKRWVRGTPGRNSGDNHAEDRSRSSRTAPVGLARDRRNRRDRPLLSIRAVALFERIFGILPRLTIRLAFLPTSLSKPRFDGDLRSVAQK